MSPVRKTEAISPPESPTPTEEDWKRARRRISLYLQMIDIPAVKELELALAAMRRARTIAADDAVEGAMDALKRLLVEEGICTSDGCLRMEHFRYAGLLPPPPGPSESTRSRPPLNRGSMVPTF